MAACPPPIDATNVGRVPSVYFALEIQDWDDRLAHLDALGVPSPPQSTRLH